LQQEDIRKRERIQDAGGTGGHMMTAIRTLNMIGTVTWNGEWWGNSRIIEKQISAKSFHGNDESMQCTWSWTKRARGRDIPSAKTARSGEEDQSSRWKGWWTQHIQGWSSSSQEAVLIILYHKDVRQVLKRTIKNPELITMYENCVNASVDLPPGASGKTEINFGGGMLEEEDEPTLKKPPNFDSSVDLWEHALNFDW
jgi:hypothetical protein